VCCHVQTLLKVSITLPSPSFHHGSPTQCIQNHPPPSYKPNGMVRVHASFHWACGMFSLPLYLSMLTWNAPQIIEISIAPHTYNRPSPTPDLIEISDSKADTDDHIGLGPYWPAPGPSRSMPATPLDDIIIINTNSESDVDSKHSVVPLSHLSPNSVSYCQ
jgi:hypothetical protein